MEDGSWPGFHRDVLKAPLKENGSSRREDIPEDRKHESGLRYECTVSCRHLRRGARGDGRLRGSHTHRRRVGPLETLHMPSLEELQKPCVWWFRTRASGTVQTMGPMFIPGLYWLFSICSP